MNNKTGVIINNKLNVRSIGNWLFGIVVLAVGLINMFWGNDPGFGVFIALLSLVYFPPVNTIIKEKLSFEMPPIVKIILGIFIIWASLGVGELFYKIDLMMMDL